MKQEHEADSMAMLGLVALYYAHCIIIDVLQLRAVYLREYFNLFKNFETS